MCPFVKVTKESVRSLCSILLSCERDGANDDNTNHKQQANSFHQSDLRWEKHNGGIHRWSLEYGVAGSSARNVPVHAVGACEPTIGNRDDADSRATDKFAVDDRTMSTATELVV
jgi:hypothetical protein